MPITYDQWMELTKLRVTKPRSESLKKLDQALKNYDQSRTRINLHHLCDAFDVWKREEPNWKTSERNQKGAATALEEMLPGTDGNKAKLDALTPMEFVLQEQEKRIDTLFRGRQLVTKSSILGTAKQAYGVYDNLQNIHRGATVLGITPGAVGNSGFEHTVRKVLVSFGGDFHVSWESDITHEVANYFGPTVLHEFVKSLVPYAGVLTSGANALWQFGKLGQSAYRHHEVKECREAVRAGDPRKAITAMEQVLRRDINLRAIKGTMAAFEAVSRGVIAACALPAVETVAAGVMAIGKLMFSIYDVAHDFIEKHQANSVLSGVDPVTYTVFDKYPLLGCYYLVCVDTSDVVNFMLKDMGTADRDWETEVKALNRSIQPAISIGQKLIHDARVEIPHMPKLKMDIPEKDLKHAHAAFVAFQEKQKRDADIAEALKMAK